jgi:hypothetical protein
MMACVIPYVGFFCARVTSVWDSRKRRSNDDKSAIAVGSHEVKINRAQINSTLAESKVVVSDLRTQASIGLHAAPVVTIASPYCLKRATRERTEREG